MDIYFIGLIVVLVAILVYILGINLLRPYLGVSRGKSTTVLLLSLFCAIGLGISAGTELGKHGYFYDWARLALIMFFPLVTIPFLAKLYFKWIGGQLTEAEKAPGMAGVRAWVRGGNLFCAVAIPVCAFIGFGCSPWGVLAVTLLMLVAFPLFNLASPLVQPMQSKPEDLSPERDRVLKMLDDGKITAAEAAELLNALAHGAQPRPAPTGAAGPHRKLVMAGLALLVIGFFLPWFSAYGLPNVQGNVMGGDVPHGLGWLILFLGLAAALAPHLAVGMDVQSRQKTVLIALGVGGIILLYLLTQNLRFVGLGLLLGLIGYTLEFIGTLKERTTTPG